MYAIRSYYGRELPADAVGLAWLVEALALFLIGCRLRHFALRGQGYVLGTLAAGAYFLVNLYRVEGMAPEEFVASQWVMVLPAVFVYYFIYWRLLSVRKRQKLERA